jgi:glyceraldehyde 3-phosphate dehydrogenase
MQRNAIMNGFGRFGLHFLAYYLDRATVANFQLLQINDENLKIEDMIEIINSDYYVKITDKWLIDVQGSSLVFRSNQIAHEIAFSNLSLGKFAENFDGILLECSGKYTNTETFPELPYVNRIFISATSLSADKTILVGFNENSFEHFDRFISYGSCTVNAYVPLAHSLNQEFGILNSDVNVIHNIPEYLLLRSPDIFERRSCTLSIMGPKLLDFLNGDNFNVNYTIIPFSGVSRIDLRFQLRESFEINDVVKVIEEISNKSGVNLYRFLTNDNGPQESLLTSYSIDLILSQSRKVGQTVYLSGYFDTENSVNRYYDLVSTIGM